LTATLFALSLVPVLRSVGAAANANPASSHTTFEFRDDFQTDTRRKYKTTGDIQWAKGQLTLKPGASLEKPLQAGPRVDCEMKVNFPDANSNGRVSETTVVFEIQDTMSGLSALQTAAGASMAAAIRIERAGESLRGILEVSEFPRNEQSLRHSPSTGASFKLPPWKQRFKLPVSVQSASWNFSYNHGLVSVFCGQKRLGAGWTLNHSASVTGIRVIQSVGRLHCLGVTIRGIVSRPAVSALQMVRLLAAGSNDLEGRRLFFAGNYREALIRLKQSYEISREVFGSDHYYTLLSRQNLARLTMEVGDYVQAERLLRDSLAMHRKVLGSDHPETATTLSHLATLYLCLSDYGRAEPLFREALKIDRSVFGDEDPQTALSLSCLGGLYERMADYARAKPLYQQALAIRRKVFGSSSTETAFSLEELADVDVLQENYAQAEPLYREALDIDTKAYGIQSGRCARILNQLGVLYERMGDFDRAARHYRQALAIQEKKVGGDAPAYAISVNHLGLLYQRMGDDAEAEPLCRQSLEIMEKNVARTNSILCERQQLEWIASMRYLLDVYLNLERGAKINGDDRYRHCLQWKGAVFAAQAQMRVLRESPELTRVFTELQSVSGQLAALAFRNPDSKDSETWKRQVHDLTEQKESIEGNLAEKSADFRRQRASLEVKPDQLRATLVDDVALIDFVEYTHYIRAAEKTGKMKRERRLAAFVLRQDRPTQFLDLGLVEPIRKNVETWRATYGTSQEAVDAARALKNAVWEPIESHLSGVATVLLSPDGDLARFPMGALPGKNEGSYLIEDLNLVVVPVPRLLPEFVAPRKEKQQAQTSLLVGDVAFDADLQRHVPKTLLADATRRAAVRFGNVYFPPLPGSAAEVEEIAALHARQFGVERQTVFRGSEATEEAFRTHAPRCTYLHLATHGFFQPVDDRRQKAQQGSQELASLEDRERVASFHPGLQCGLAMAGANRKTAESPTGAQVSDDGILTAVEVASLDLRGVELVTLSACETGLGKSASGEGVLGLQRAFQIAGARNVVASLWKVDDKGTVALMRLFYHKLWAEKKSPAIALREAQLAILRNPDQTELLATTRGPVFEKMVKLTDRQPRSSARRSASPRLWAAFILSGDWR
jgi:CHAT domain-containing protein/Tfp pilus assembly protein PilF